MKAVQIETRPKSAGQTMEESRAAAEAFARTPFDFLVIGGGTAGLAVAARLSEDPHLRVGVLEAGSPALGDRVVDMPGLAGSALDTGLDWKFETTVQPGLGGRAIPWARGKVLGGSSALNYMTWNRASRLDYDDWAELGNTGWGWEDLLQFFKKSETFHPPTLDTQIAARVGWHGDALGATGPVQVSYPKEYTASHGLWHQTMNALGVEPNKSHLTGTNTGCWTSLCSLDPQSATRSYAATAYYQPNALRQNLVVLPEAEVREILLVEGEGGAGWEAKGARFAHNGIEFSAFASREVILSAGSVQSPQILELSGVGNPEVLSAAGIPVKVDNPNVGEHLQDHVTNSMVFEVDSSLPNPDDLKTAHGLEAAQEEYAKSKSGQLTVVPVSVSYVPASHAIPGEKLDAILSSSTTATASADEAFADREALLNRKFTDRRHQLGHVEYIFDLGNWSPYFEPNADENKKYASMLQIIQFPFSRGSIHIRPSTEPGAGGGAGALAINPQYFAGRRGQIDLEIAVEGSRFAEKICATEPLASIVRARVFPSASDLQSDDGRREWIKKTMVTDWHPVGTCSMGGRAGPRAGVVDERLRVYGVRRLRVVDASVMPLQISAHLQATVYAIAEKAAHMILQDLGGRS
ncbi:choline dehydrogenase [Thozetella sp. PMI_491]|nr:choline dehydrogenase [Thozetella sp. PMI_491]